MLSLSCAATLVTDTVYSSVCRPVFRHQNRTKSFQSCGVLLHFVIHIFFLIDLNVLCECVLHSKWMVHPLGAVIPIPLNCMYLSCVFVRFVATQCTAVSCNWLKTVISAASLLLHSASVNYHSNDLSMPLVLQCCCIMSSLCTHCICIAHLCTGIIIIIINIIFSSWNV